MTLAKGCPALAAGGGVEVGELAGDVSARSIEWRAGRLLASPAVNSNAVDLRSRLSGRGNGHARCPPEEAKHGSRFPAARSRDRLGHPRPIAEEPPCPPRLPPTARSSSASRASSTTSPPGSRRRTRRCSPSTAGSRSPTSRTCGPRSGRPRPTTRSTRTRSPAGPPPTPASTEMAELLEGPVAIAFVRPEGDAVTAAKALRDFAKTNPNLVVKGGMLGPRVLSVQRRRDPRRRAAPRRAARPPRRRLPGPAREGGRPVPGLHPQLRLRPEGATSTRCPPKERARRSRRACGESDRRHDPSPKTRRAPRPAAANDRGRVSRDRPRDRQKEKRTDGNDEQRGPARGLQEHDRARAERVPQGVRGGVRRHGGRPGRGRGGRWRRRGGARGAPRSRTSST